MNNSHTPPNLLNDTPLSTAPIEDESDTAAMVLEATTTTTTRDHHRECGPHHPAPSAPSEDVTWIASLHPEEAEITIDRGFFAPGDPWWALYGQIENIHIPMAIAVPIPNNPEDPIIAVLAVPDGDNNNNNNYYYCNDDDDRGGSSEHAAATTAAASNDEENAGGNNDNNYSGCFCTLCPPVGLALCVWVGVPAMLAVLILEMVALVLCHGLSTLFYYVARVFAPPNCCTCLLYCVFLVVHKLLRCVDSILLLVSVAVTEALGSFAFLFGFCTGGLWWARYLQQENRRLCHGLRILFRKSNDENGSHPPRASFCSKKSTATTTTTTTTPDEEERIEPLIADSDRIAYEDDYVTILTRGRRTENGGDGSVVRVRATRS